MSAGSDLIMLPSCDYAGSFMRAKLLQFHENYRPAYYGTWRKHSSVISARHPLKLDTSFFDYDVDSDEDWEEEEPGESLSHSEVHISASSCTILETKLIIYIYHLTMVNFNVCGVAA